MVLVDVGNTNVGVVYEREGEFENIAIIPTIEVNVRKIKGILSVYKEEKVLVCSVVPRITQIFRDINKNKNIYIVGEDIEVPVRSLYKKDEVGQDRLVGVFAAGKDPHTRLVIDFGTAITFDFISLRGDYLGGFIFPGIKLCLQALSQCALLKDKTAINLLSSRGFPKDTVQSINRGIKEGISGMVNYFVNRYVSFEKGEKVVITGGGAEFIFKHLKFRFTYEPYLIFKGLLLLGRFL